MAMFCFHEVDLIIFSQYLFPKLLNLEVVVMGEYGCQLRIRMGELIKSVVWVWSSRNLFVAIKAIEYRFFRVR
jgi:hypothetical protein